MANPRTYQISPQIEAQVNALSEDSVALAYDAIEKLTLAGWAWRIFWVAQGIAMTHFIYSEGQSVLSSELIALAGLVILVWLKWPIIGTDDPVLAYMETLSRLPFELAGYVQSLGRDHRTLEREYHTREWVSCIVVIKFMHDNGAEHSPARAALEVEDYYGIQETGENEISLTVPHLMRVGRDTRFGWRYDGNRKLCRWFTKFLAETLVPLHTESPIESVHVMLVNERSEAPDPLEYN